MNFTRNGKIARLPRTVRDELNRRLLDGEVGRRLVAWLNDLPEVRAVLEAEFGGRPINEPNLTAWRQQGFPEWLLEQEARELAAEVGSGAKRPSTEALVRSVVARCSMFILRLEGSSHTAEHRKLLCTLAGYVDQLRRTDFRARKAKWTGPAASQSRRHEEN